MKLLSLFLVITTLASTSKAVILLPGKIEEVKRADQILADKYKKKKELLERNREFVNQRFALKKKQLAKKAVVANPPPAPDENVQARGITNGTPVPEPPKPLQDVKETSN